MSQDNIDQPKCYQMHKPGKNKPGYRKRSVTKDQADRALSNLAGFIPPSAPGDVRKSYWVLRDFIKQHQEGPADT